MKKISHNEPYTVYEVSDGVNLTSKFRADLNTEKCKQFLLWANIGFTNQILDDIRNSQIPEVDYKHMVTTLDEYLDELRKIFYKPNNE